MMSKKSCLSILLQGAAFLVCSAQLAFAGNVSVNINVGEPPRPVVVAPPPPVYVPAPEPVYVAPPPPAPVELIVVEDDFDFVYPSTLGFYVAVGIPYDLFYLDDCYYLYRDGRWLRARSSRGPWVAQRYRELPPELRRHRVERIREYRNREYAIYRRDRDHYRGKHFRSEKEHWKEHRREAREIAKDERRYEKERRKDEREYEKERRRREERRHEKEDRREHRERRGD